MGGGSKNRGPEYSTLSSRILIIRTPNKVPLIFGNSHIAIITLLTKSHGPYSRRPGDVGVRFRG